MGTWQNRLLRALAVGGFSIAVVGADVSPTGPSTRETMRELYAQLQVLLPAAVQGSFSDPAKADAVGGALRSLERRAEFLDDHAQGLDPGARLFGQALARDARRALLLFEQGKFENSEFFVESLVDDCVACHTRLPAVDSSWAEGFVERRELEALDLLERAQIQVATRRFDKALDTYEAVFRSPNERPELLLGPLADYLSVALRVERDPTRARSLLANQLERKDLSPGPRADIQHWSDRLAEVTPAALEGRTLARARAASQRADAAAGYPGDPRALIEYLVASAQLYQLIQQPQDSPADAAEIYYLLGRAELGISRAAWLPRADLFLETAIRLAPESRVARDAFALLEEETLAGYTGSGGLRLPPEEEARLAALRQLMEQDQIGTPANLELSQVGERLYTDHCAFCHGSDAKGEGPALGILMTTPKDLTRIAARRGGTFPVREVRELIDGRDPIGGHRSPEMPRWGEYWSEPTKLDAVVAYLRLIQE